MKPVFEIFSNLSRYISKASNPIPADFRFACRGRLAYALVLDASPSMEIEDYLPSRFAAAKQSANGFLERCAEQTPEALVGVIFYSDSAQLCSSLVPAKQNINQLRRALDAGEVSPTTNISAGLLKARDELVAQ